MPRSGETPITFDRLMELAAQADRLSRCRFTPFLTPPEAELAQAAARRTRVEVALSGGYDGAERQMARFTPPFVQEEPFPLTALEITWPHQDAPGHRDLLGAVMGLGLRRSRVGDIALEGEHAWLFVEATLAQTVAQGLTEAGRTRLSLRVAEALPALAAPQGEEIRFTVQSARLDAVIADGFHLSRGDAAELVTAGAVKLCHAPTLRPDARVDVGDTVSVRGYGRLRIEEIGSPTRKGRLPVQVTRFGVSR